MGKFLKYSVAIILIVFILIFIALRIPSVQDRLLNIGLANLINAESPLTQEDALSAIEMIRNKAKKYNIDPNKIGLMGFSAGGAVTMEATYKATPKNQPNFIAPIYPWMDIVDKQKVPQNKPPAFISCANDDSIAASSVQVYNDWISANAKVELHMFSKGGHGFGMNDLSIPVGKWSDLLVDWILSL